MVGLFFPVFLLRGPIRKSGSWHSAAPVDGVVPTLAAERQVRDFVIGPRNKKQRKKRSAINIRHPPFQITISDF
jgi:hypothetical protein